MAGAGFKTFNTGDVLTASDVNTYLMQQTVMVFADSSARSTALGANVAEGMISYLKDTNAVERYDGSSWGAIGAGDIEGVTAGAGLSGGGTSGTVTLNLNSLSAGRNAVINGGFDIWQRGTSLNATGTMYVADRWAIVGTPATFTVSRQATADSTNLPNIQYSARIQRANGQTNTTTFNFMTGLESANSVPFAGKSVTISFYARAGANYSPTSSALPVTLYSGTGTDQTPTSAFTGQATAVSGTATLTTTWQRFSYTGTVSSTATQLKINFDYAPTGTAGANDWVEITGVQLELGSSATPFSRAGGTIAGELQNCQRYYESWTAGGANYGLPGAVVWTSATAGKIQVNFAVPKRVAPSVTFANVYTTSGGAAVTPTAMSFFGNSTSSGVIGGNTNITSASGGTNGYAGYVVDSGGGTGYINWSAEL